MHYIIDTSTKLKRFNNSLLLHDKKYFFLILILLFKGKIYSSKTFALASTGEPKNQAKSALKIIRCLKHFQCVENASSDNLADERIFFE